MIRGKTGGGKTEKEGEEHRFFSDFYNAALYPQPYGIK